MYPRRILVNPNIWHMKVPSVVYVTVEMHQSNRVLRQFEFWQSIPVAPEGLDDVHTTDLWGWTDENWLIFHVQYINMWDNMYEFLTTREAIIALKLACNPDYMSWFRIRSKPYLYGEEAKSRQMHMKRPRRASIHPRIGGTGPSSALMQETAPIVAPSMVAPPTGQYVPSYSDAYTNPFIFTQAPYIQPHFLTSTSMSSFAFGPPSPMYYTPMPSTFPTMMMPTTSIGRLYIRHQPKVQSLCYRCMGHNIVVLICRLCCKHLRDHCSTKVVHLANHLFLGQRIHNGRGQYPNWRLNQEGISARNRQPPLCGTDFDRHLH
ncbi:hypothetical protein Gohar_013269 [Gossypium harknessii]|uniref:Uncharacterized protein n=1 Tax=Gossypium harknessii TaxID=34285 RepID=A0A7J9GZH6_9ROSI|nr:hypothetical protein [Gossypium harknessii]